jgi:thiamine monophosphate synthase
MSLPRGKIGKYEISRLICGGNLFRNFAHSGELKYVSRLFDAYFTDEKVVETLSLCADNGINTFLGRTDDHVARFLDKYEQARGERIQWIAQTATERKPIEVNIKFATDHGAIACFTHGGTSDELAAQGNIARLGECVSAIRENGMIAGVGSHRPETIKAVHQEGIDVDFFFLTINNVGYQCENPELASETMRAIDKPFIGFKTLGAGRTGPREGFKFAAESGADFIAVGMFDFQVKEDVAIAEEVFRSLNE